MLPKQHTIDCMLRITALALGLAFAIVAGSAAQAAGKLGGSTGADEFKTDRGR